MRHLACLFLCLSFLFSCKERGAMETQKPKDYSSEEIQLASNKTNLFLDEAFEEELAMYPEWQARLGRKTNYNSWNDLSEEQAVKDNNFFQEKLKELRASISLDALDESTRLSYKLYQKRAEEKIKNFDYRHYDYPVNQMFGTHSGVPSFLINNHSVGNKEEAQAYLDRLEGIPTLFDQLIAKLKANEEAGVVPPKFVFPKAIRDCKNIIAGAPFSKTDKKNTLYADFEKKINALELDQEMKKTYLLGCEKRLMTNVKPAYEKLISFLEAQEARATDDDGAWKFPDGKAFYDHQLQVITTTDLTAEDIHQIGLEEVKRIHTEMQAIMKQVGFKGTLQEFFAFMRDDKQFYYPNTPEGKKAYMDKATAIIEEMKSNLDGLFITKPKAELTVKAVEPYREKSAGKAFYNSPAPDGSRPGVYYANTYDMADMPKYQMEALAYHEGIPGHHMQLSIAQEMDELPKFRRFAAHYTAYVEGWGLYSEFLPKEIGFYKDPYADFGRLAMELWRACRLVVDTGIHSKKWTREEGTNYYKENTPNSEGDCIKMVDRHIVMPGQATAYKIGMLKILEIREKAKTRLGDAFDIRKFHEIVLTNGALPLDVLEDRVNTNLK